MARWPLPDESCQPYEAKNGVCDASGQCRNCFHPTMVDDPSSHPPVQYTSPGCFSVESGPRYGVTEYGGVHGERAMQAEIAARGPIVCSLAADLTFMLHYQNHTIDGVYFDPSYLPPGGAPSAHNASEIDHDVEVTGWGVSPRGVPYWTVRNSWGTYWGERGWFRILRGSNHLFIEQDCAWAVVDASALEESLGTHALGDYVTGAQAVPMDADGAVLGRIRREGSGATTATAATSVATAAATPLTSRAPSSHPPSSHPPSSRASRGGGTIVAAGAARAAPAPATDALSTAVVSAVAPGFVLGGCLIALATVVVLTRVTRARGRSTACDEGGGTAGWKRPGTVFYAWRRSDEHIAALLQERAEPLLPAAAAAPSCGGRGAAGSGAVGSMPVR